MSEQHQPPVPLREHLANRLAGSTLSAEAQSLLLEALGDDSTTAGDSAPSAYLQSVTVSGFRGIGELARLDLSPGNGVTLVVGRNGSGKSSFAEAVEIAFTGDNARWSDRSEVWRSNWRNLHQGEEPKVAVQLCIDGDRGPSTLRRSWNSDDVQDSSTELHRPGHGKGTVADLGWDRALTLYRPFLSYAELGQVITGKPTEAYDAVARILGLGRLTDADKRLADRVKKLETAIKAAAAELPPLLAELGGIDDPRATAALTALAPKSPDFAAIAQLVSGTQAVDEEATARLRHVAGLSGPDLAGVGAAVDRLREAVTVMNDVRHSGARPPAGGTPGPGAAAQPPAPGRRGLPGVLDGEPAGRGLVRAGHRAALGSPARGH